MVRWLNAAGDTIDNDATRGFTGFDTADSTTNDNVVATAIDIYRGDVDRTAITSGDVDVGVSKGRNNKHAEAQGKDNQKNTLHSVFLLNSKVRQLLPKLAKVYKSLLE
ncbi:hypothetical protein IKQ19_00455 [Candidatus Saccharibacteria bacterium]|nr:hypothetical protein [Candidatus Saccharibacteria bacterium]